MTQSAITLNDQPIPMEASVEAAGWLGRARHYPVFSVTWYRYRTLSTVALMVALECIVAVAAVASGSDVQTVLAVLIPSGLAGALLCAVAPGLAVLVRRQHLAPRKEAISIVMALAIGFTISDLSGDAIHYLFKLGLMGDGHARAQLVGSGSVKITPEAPAAKAADVVGPPVPAKVLAPRAELAAEARSNYLGAAITWALKVWLAGGWSLIAYFGQRRRIAEALRQQALAKAQAARNEAELKLSVLAAQIEPHFLFNTLAGVRSAVVSDPERAVVIIDHLVAYLRATIPQLRSEGGSTQGRLGSQVDAARAYLGLMRARIPRLAFDFEVDASVNDAHLPPLTLISLVENAVKHGIEPKIGPGHITVSAKRLFDGSAALLVVSVSDDGVGFGGTTAGSGIGLANIRERFRVIYGEKASLVLKARPDGGVIAEVRLPLFMDSRS
ncbi:sensor histidine kinase [Chitinimonas sp.]|uniref:sensor histidine kinase n=1 Tax=Chitinimonas sp. TaxID=1934313 RepID=UPI0035AFF25E